uniref:Reverse transcriptase domain-containing protein n=2 Tax=Kryptolebias marmoratus TaxID=37003 RepID=A0A3Q3H395_KRYMA
MSGSLRIVTWNVQGLGHVIKKKKVLTFLKKNTLDIALLQETRLSATEHLKLKRDWVGNVYFSAHSQNKKGTAILIHKNLPFILEHEEKDSEGRFILITGSIHGQHITILNVYAPNDDSPQFISRMILLFNHHCKGIGFLAGDFNCVMNASLDRSSAAKLPNPKASAVLKNLCTDTGLIDIWRHLHPKTRDYTFYSHPHNSYSRLDYFFIPKSLLHLVQSCNLDPIVLSDHAPVFLSVDPVLRMSRTFTWKFNTSFLDNEPFRNFVRNNLLQFWLDNKESPVSSAMIWDAAKATLRGYLISYCSHQKAARAERRNNLEKEVIRLEQIHKQSPILSNLKALMAVKSELNIDYTRQVQKLLLYTKQKYYEFGNKPSRMLSHLLKNQNNSRLINMIRTQNEDVSYDPKIINSTFRDFYTSLYNTDMADPEDITSYLSNISLPSVTGEDRAFLDAAITPEEVWAAIKSMPNGKCPGPDGFPLEFFKSFWPEIQPILMPAVNDILRNGIPPSWRHASISLLLKEGKSPLDCSSFRPISLLNVDYKIVAKVLARRLENILPKIINPDQAGFIKMRYGTDNIRRVLNVVQYLNTHKKPAVIVSLDAEKAFDRVEWQFLFQVLHKFGLGPNFINLVKSFYSDPTASVNTNGLMSEPFKIHRGCRQGCPLSPLLFTLFIEPLAEIIRTNPDVSGINIGGRNHVISLFADDVLLYMCNPEKSIPAILESMATFSALSGYKINLGKSVATPFGIPSENLTQSPFQLSMRGFKYLGISVPPDLNNLFGANYSPLIQKIKHDLIKWAPLPSSFLGRINIIKMNILPRLNYLYQNLPCYLSPAHFKSLNSHLSRFVWNYKHPRVKFSTLTKPKHLGGLSLPSLQLYYWAAQLKIISNWFMNRCNSLWLDLESQSCLPSKLNSLFFISGIDQIPHLRSNFIVYNTLLAWRDVKKYLNISPTLSSWSSLTLNPDLPAEIRNIGLSEWSSRGLSIIMDILDSDSVKSFEQIKADFNISNRDFYKYLQIRHFVNSLRRTGALRTRLSELENIIVMTKSPKGLISKIYSLLSGSDSSAYDAMKLVWEHDLGLKFDLADWEEICIGIFPSCTSISIHEQNFKFFYRTYYTPVRLRRMFPDTSDLCCKCKTHRGTFIHLFWSCNRIQVFWKAVHLMIQEIFGKRFPLTPSFCLFNHTSEILYNADTKHLLVTLLFLAKKCILLRWLAPQAPTVDMWISQISDIVLVEKLTHDLHQRSDRFWGIWDPIQSFLQRL